MSMYKCVYLNFSVRATYSNLLVLVYGIVGVSALA